MRWLLVSAAFLLSLGQLISTAFYLRSAGNYDEYMPDLEDIVSPENTP